LFFICLIAVLRNTADAGQLVCARDGSGGAMCIPAETVCALIARIDDGEWSKERYDSATEEEKKARAAMNKPIHETDVVVVPSGGRGHPIAPVASPFFG
jgi:hypothetical protein